MAEPTDGAAVRAAEIRAALDAAIIDALPISGGQVRKRLKQLRRALAECDRERQLTARLKEVGRG